MDWKGGQVLVGEGWIGRVGRCNGGRSTDIVRYQNIEYIEYYENSFWGNILKNMKIHSEVKGWILMTSYTSWSISFPLFYH